MPLLGAFGWFFFAGLAMFALGHLLFWTTLARHDGLDRSRTMHVVFDDDSPMKRPENRRDRLLFRAGVFLIAMGLMTFFTALSVGDERELRLCTQKCHERGQNGRFAPSGTVRDAAGQPVRACWCVSATGSTELPQETLPPLAPPGAPSGGPPGAPSR
jgi:hypothetical protein